MNNGTIIATFTSLMSPHEIIGEGGLAMLAYEFYWVDEIEKAHFIGILPERRKKAERITQESILNWGKMVVGENTEVKEMYYVKVEF